MNIEMKYLHLGDISIEVEQKDIKNIHLSVYPPVGRVRIAAPSRMDIDTIRIYAISKLKWIKKQQEKLRNQERESPREFLNKESHYFNGNRYLLQIVEKNAPPIVKIEHSTIKLYIRPGTNIIKMRIILDEWYRTQLKSNARVLIKQWEDNIDIKVNEFGIKKMKTKWGTCNREAKRIWLNLELAKKPPECLEYIVVHEIVHLLEKNHNDRFVSLMDKFMPKWRFYKDELNRLPVRHEHWKY